jgi:hypothetical protein
MELLFHQSYLYAKCKKLGYNYLMSKRNQKGLMKAYSKYRTTKKTKSSVLGFFRDLMPEIIFRTTKLEGEPVTKKMVSNLFK